MMPCKMFTFTVLFILVRVVCTQECSTCQCCADGYHPKCSSRGYCNNGCIDGYYGAKCNYKCTSHNCLRCHRRHGNICLKCTFGYYLNNYNCFDCRPQCQSCSSYGCNSCYDGYWGNPCDTKCAQNCVSCSKSDGKCLFCASGYFFHDGKCITCDIHCAVCGTRGCTSCHDGYWGSSCDKNCAQNCASCSKSDGYCLSCRSGHYLNNTFCYACGIHCSSCESTGCQDCLNGRWGGTCEKCCLQRCSESKCEQSNGYCLSCVPGYWGNKCEQSCRHHCLACNKSSGECISCKHGYWRHLCTACGSRCKVCNQINGCSDVGNTSEKQTTLTAALGGGLGGGFMALIILAIIAMLWFHNRRRSNTEHNDLRHNDSLHEAQGDYTTVDANLRGVELNDLRYETLKGTDVHTMDQTTDYSNVSEKVNDNNTYQNVLGGSLSD
ncbi:scavenger receptor class F member 1-like [Mya arenaria]|uniref:scavenger receptor class F member 1-like n=1 Tax=Mya arenaria TaxID=6604 RepID=UPI0022E02294|nr:scavenger receptor class F member 1-like [Mya arenaria]